MLMSMSFGSFERSVRVLNLNVPRPAGGAGDLGWVWVLVGAAGVVARLPADEWLWVARVARGILCQKRAS